MSAYWKDAFREINRSLGRYISLIVITALGAASVVGILATSINMRAIADKTYKEHSLYDIQIKSTTGFNDNDIAALSNVPGVDVVMPTNSFDVYSYTDNEILTMRTYALPDELNKVELLAGRLPENIRECAVEEAMLRNLGMHIGDKITLGLSNMDDYYDVLSNNEFTIVGVVRSPYFIIPYNRGNTQLGNGRLDYYMYLHPDTYVLDVYTDVYILMKDSLEMDNLTVAYYDAVEEWVQNVKKIGDVRIQADKYAEAQQRIDDGWAAYHDGYNRWRDGVESVARGEIPAWLRIEGVQRMLDEAQLDLENAQNELEDAQRRLDVARENAADTPKTEWYYLTRSDGVSFDSFYQDMVKLEVVGYTLPLLFYIVAVLVSLTTMSRMVDERRTQIGIYKALGYGHLKTGIKFLFYAFSASAAGGAIGVIAGSQTFPRLIYKAYLNMYEDMPPIETPIPVAISLITIAISVAAIMIVTFIAIMRSMRNSPASMMRPKTPPPGKKVTIEKIPFLWNHFGFTSKVTARNIFRYKKRLFMTLAGVASCTALLLTSFGLRDSLSAIPELQFGELVKYTSRAYIKEITTEQERADFDALLTGEWLYVREETVRADNGFDAALIVPENAERLSDFICLRSRNERISLSLANDGVLVTEKLARENGVSPGGSINITTSRGASYTIKVLGIVENYAEHFIYMSPKLYEDLFGSKPLFNGIFAITADDEKFAEALRGNDNVMAIIPTEHLRETAWESTEVLQIVIIVMIALACALALVVLFNLTNINITERIRELATVKVMGFYNAELSMYIYRESGLVSMMGIVLGLVCGIFMHRYVLMAVETDLLMFPRLILPLSYVYSAALVIMFALFVNLVMSSKLARIDMVESLKNVE